LSRPGDCHHRPRVRVLVRAHVRVHAWRANGCNAPEPGEHKPVQRISTPWGEQLKIAGFGYEDPAGPTPRSWAGSKESCYRSEAGSKRAVSPAGSQAGSKCHAPAQVVGADAATAAVAPVPPKEELAVPAAVPSSPTAPAAAAPPPSPRALVPTLAAPVVASAPSSPVAVAPMALAPAVMAVAAGGFGPTETPVRQVAALEEVCRRSEAALNAEILKLCANEGAVPDAAASVDRGGAMKLTTESLSKALGANTLAANAAAAAAALEVPGDVESTSLAVSGDSASEAPAPTSEQETFGTGTSEPFAAVAEAAAPAPEKEASPPVEAFAPVTSGPEEESVLAPETSEAFAAVGEEALGPVPEKETTHAIEEASTGAAPSSDWPPSPIDSASRRRPRRVKPSRSRLVLSPWMHFLAWVSARLRLSRAPLHLLERPR